LQVRRRVRVADPAALLERPSNLFVVLTHAISSGICPSTHSSVVVVDLFEELVEMGFLVLEELKFLLALFVLNLFALAVALLDCLDLGLQFDDLVLLLGLAGLEVSDTLLEVGLAVLGLELLAHGEGN